MDAQAEMVSALEALVVKAKTGELEGFAAALLLSNSRVAISVAGEAWSAPTTTIGLLWEIQYELHAHGRPAPSTPPT